MLSAYASVARAIARAARLSLTLASSAVGVVLVLLTFASPFLGKADAAGLSVALVAQESDALPSIDEKTRGMDKRDGFLPVYWDADEGKIWLEVPSLEEELLYVESLAAGVGSNDIGLDRGQLGGERVVRFQRVGRRVLMVQPNYAYRAQTPSAAERRAVRDAFATSVLWGFEVAAEQDGRVLVDATDFVLRDAHDVSGTLDGTGQGSYRLEKSRSAPYLERTKGFPDNTEIEATLTFTGDDPGAWLRSVTPTPEALTVRQRHSFIRLPPPGYEPRESHPGAGFFGIAYADYAMPIDEPITKRFIARHRLEKRDPAAAVSEAVEPIVYYVDPGVPEPIRGALVDGAAWWAEAFEAAGYRDAFRVEILPDGADPMDVRYNVIQWVHRATRGWSYGASVSDPRTGEIIKGHVSLGSLRVRQDFLLAEGLLAPYERGDEAPPELAAMALARIRQLSAHEVGHTIGLAHNYIASAQGRASVMDYPHPLARLTDSGEIDLSDAYDSGVGEWDVVAVAYGYQDFAEGTDEPAALEEVISSARARGITFVSDQDARPAGSAHPQVHLWDNGTDAAAELERMMDVRRAALDRFGERAIRAGRPMATMEEALVPLYLHHRYQVDAAAKVLGGLEYSYALRGDGQAAPSPVPASAQRRALAALLRTLSPAELALPEGVATAIPPRPFTYGPHRELFDRWTGLTFDAVSPAAAAADVTLGMLLHGQRAARLIQQNAFDGSLPGLAEVMERLVDAAWDARPADAYQAEVARAVRRAVAEHLMAMVAGADAPQVRAEALLALEEVAARARRDADAAAVPADRAAGLLLARDLERFADDPEDFARPPSRVGPPPGSPIGEEAGWRR
ncbi:MAG: zinc-dependent metalloprotease [Gemmatimonadota bacterium]